MSNKIKEVIAVFENGDKMVLQLKGSTFAGYKSQVLWELFYAERVEGNHESVSDDEPVSDDPHFFNVYETEYFPASMFDTAYSAFRTRLSCSNPIHESDMGFSLDRMLTKE